MSNHAHLIIPCQRGVATKAGSVHSIFSKDRKPGKKEGAILCLKDPLFQSSVDWPPEVHQKPTSNPTKNTQQGRRQDFHRGVSK